MREIKKDDANNEDLVALYMDGFADSLEYARWFIGRAEKKNIIQKYDNDVLVSAGYIFEKRAMLFGKERMLPYLSALSTKSNFRGQGKIFAIIKDAFERLYHRGHFLTVLNPFNDDYYKKYGFENISFCRRGTISGGRSFTIKKAEISDIDILCLIESLNVASFENFLIKERAEILDLVLGFQAENVPCMIVFDLSGAPIAFYIKSETRIEYYASIGPDIIETVGALNGALYEDCFTGNDVYIQGRIINAEKSLLECAYVNDCNGIYCFEISDEILGQNNKMITLEIANGKAEISGKAYDKKVSMDVSELCARMFCGDEIFRKTKSLFKDKY